MDSVIPLFFSFLFVVLLTPIVISVSRKLNLVDLPDNNRKIHKTPIPRTGGVVLFLAFMWFVLIYLPNFNELKFFIFGASVIFLLGLYDDIVGIKWYYKFVIQIISAVFLILNLYNMGIHNFVVFNVEIPPFILYPLLIVFIVGGLNSFNLLDGIDGLVTSLSLFISLMILLIQINVNNQILNFLTFILIGITLGFLKFNNHPAKIFLGDSGSLFISYLIILIVFLASYKLDGGKVDLIFPAMVFALPMIDTIRVMFERILARKNPFLPDKNHIHHIFQFYKVDQKFSVLIILLISFIAFGISIIYLIYNKTYGLLIFIFFCLLLLNIKKLLRFTYKYRLLKFTNGKEFYFVPNFIRTFYSKFLVKIISLLILLLFCYALQNDDLQYKSLSLYLSIFISVTIIYSMVNLIIYEHYSELMVFINFFILFLITNSDQLFYKLIKIPVIGYFDLNKIAIIVLTFMIILYFILRDVDILKIKNSFFSSIDLTLLLITFSFFFFTELIGIKLGIEKFNDVFLRSFLVYIFYKIIITIYPSSHRLSYILSFLFPTILIIRTWF